MTLAEIDEAVMLRRSAPLDCRYAMHDRETRHQMEFTGTGWQFTILKEVRTMKRLLLFAVAALFAGACTGPAGMTGPQGPTGMTGSQGSTGMTGSQGSTGMTGSQGSTGMTGSQGLAGVAGAQGSAGVAGAQGLTGTPGAQSPALSGTPWVSLRDFTFDYDRTDIRSAELNQPSEIAVYMRQNPSVRLGIDGSTDLLRGTNQYNTALSARRMATVRDALIQAGVSADRIETGAFAAPRASCNDSIERCSQRDGRVEVLARANN